MPKLSFDAIEKKLAELNKLKQKLEASRDNARQKSVPKVFVLMKKLGVSLDDLVAASGKKGGTGHKAAGKGNRGKKASGSSKEVRYRHPDTGETWIGKGRPPAWITELEKAGRDRKEFLIHKAQ
jgi:DNA-binding protein H-NS